ncbi:MAG: MarR family winged helix-turn-helix transcriptional regulator [Methylocystaceae bacterium]
MSNTNELLIDLLREVNRGLGKFVKDILAEHDLPITMGIVTRQIGSTPGITISELSRLTGIAKSHISKTIRELDERGWVEKREDSTDQRLLRLYLNPIAIKYLEQARQDIRQRINELVADIPEERAIELVVGLTDIKAALEQVHQKEKK